jgi:ribulose-bisphosphate carboxylase large chain
MLASVLNVLFGNSSMKDNLKIIKISLPDGFLRHFSGPRYGIDGLREKMGIYNRPIAYTALKPMGAPIKKLAKMADGFVLGGGDILKDDHGLSDPSYHPFKERVLRCQEAVSQANARAGNHAIFCPMISGRFDEIEEQVQFAIGNGVQAILIAPMLVGFDTMRYIAEQKDAVLLISGALIQYAPDMETSTRALMEKIHEYVDGQR